MFGTDLPDFWRLSAAASDAARGGLSAARDLSYPNFPVNFFEALTKSRRITRAVNPCTSKNQIDNQSFLRNKDQTSS